MSNTTHQRTVAVHVPMCQNCFGGIDRTTQYHGLMLWLISELKYMHFLKIRFYLTRYILTV